MRRLHSCQHSTLSSVEYNSITCLTANGWGRGVFAPGYFRSLPTDADGSRTVSCPVRNKNVILKGDVVEANPFNLPAVDEPALAGAVKRKWRERLQSCGIRLVLTATLDRPRRKAPCENIGQHNSIGRR